MLTTTDAEILFVQTDNTLLHGETIKVSTYMYPISVLYYYRLILVPRPIPRFSILHAENLEVWEWAWGQWH